MDYTLPGTIPTELHEQFFRQGLMTVNEARGYYLGGTALAIGPDLGAYWPLPTIRVTTCSYCRSQRNELWERCRTCGAPLG